MTTIVGIWALSSLFIMFQLAIFFLFFFFFSYHKSYAMLYISDDAFLAKAAIVQSIMNGSSRMIFGFMYDKLGFKVKPFQTILCSRVCSNKFANFAVFILHPEFVQCCFLFYICQPNAFWRKRSWGQGFLHHHIFHHLWNSARWIMSGLTASIG